MNKTQHGSMQCLAPHFFYEAGNFRRKKFFPSHVVTIEWITHDGVSLMRQVHTDLMGTSRFQTAAYKADTGALGVSKILQGFIIGDGLLASAGPDRHFLPVSRAASNLTYQAPPGRGRCTPYERQIAPADAVSGKLGRKKFMGAIIFGRY